MFPEDLFNKNRLSRTRLPSFAKNCISQTEVLVGFLLEIAWILEDLLTSPFGGHTNGMLPKASS